MEKVTRWSGADWASEKKEMMIVGLGGIGSWLTLNLSRIGHSLYLIDDDIIDETNVTGGQMFKYKQIGAPKVVAIRDICREFGCDNSIDTFPQKYSSTTGSTDIMITGLDNMKARRETFESWRKRTYSISDKSKCLFVDGRLTIEMWEIFAIQGNDEKAIEAFDRDHLFTDEESIALDCSTKQSTFAAMSIAASMTSTICNFLTNIKLGEEIRTVPFYERMYFPIKMSEIKLSSSEGTETTIKNEKIEIVNE